MDLLTWIYLIYSFLAFYFLIFFILIYSQHKNELMQIPKITKEYSVSCVVPCYNEEVSIGKTIEMLAKNGYSGLKKIIVVDDRSTEKI